MRSSTWFFVSAYQSESLRPSRDANLTTYRTPRGHQGKRNWETTRETTSTCARKYLKSRMSPTFEIGGIQLTRTSCAAKCSSCECFVRELTTFESNHVTYGTIFMFYRYRDIRRLSKNTSRKLIEDGELASLQRAKPDPTDDLRPSSGAQITEEMRGQMTRKGDEGVRWSAVTCSDIILVYVVSPTIYHGHKRKERCRKRRAGPP